MAQGSFQMDSYLKQVESDQNLTISNLLEIMDIGAFRDYSEFCEQLNEIRTKFHKWDSCERTVALYYLMSGLPFANARFLQHVLEHCISAVSTPDVLAVEQNANDAIFIRNLMSERIHVALSGLLTHLPLLRPGNKETAECYLTVIRKVLTEVMSPPFKIYNDCVEIMSYVLVHPAFDKEDKKSFKHLLKQMIHRVHPENFNHSPVNEQTNDDPVSPNPEPTSQLNGQQPEACLRMGRRSNSLTPVQTASHENLIPTQEVWSSQENLSSPPHKPRSYSLSNDKTLPLNVPSMTSSSSETRLQDLQTLSNLPIMKGIVFWLKSLRLHKYSWVFTNLTYEQMLNLTEERLQAMGITKGARHKLLLSINKLKERSAMMTELETEVMNGGDLLAALKKLKTVLQSPLQVTSGEDLPSQFVKVMGKVCTQLLMLRQPAEECLSLFSGLCERAESLEAFNLEQRRRLALWRTQLTRGNSIPVPTQRHNTACNNTRQQNVQSQYYLPMSSLSSYSQQVYGQKSSSYPNVQGNQAVGAHRNSLGNLNHNVNLSTAAATLPHLTKTDIPSNPYHYSQLSNGGGSGGGYNSIPIRFQPQISDEKKAKQIMKNTDIESSLESLCLQMMEHALGP